MVVRDFNSFHFACFLVLITFEATDLCEHNDG